MPRSSLVGGAVSNLRVGDLMTKGVFSVRPDTPVAGLHGLMSEKRIRHVPVVVENGKFVGLVSHRDVLRCAFPLDEAQPVSARVDLLTSVRVGDIMTQDVKTVQADTDLAVAARIMFLHESDDCAEDFQAGDHGGGSDR